MFSCQFVYLAKIMEVTLSAFLFLYLIYIAFFLFFSFFNLFHMVRFGFSGFWAYVITVGYIVATAFALFVSYFYIARIDWTYTFQLFASGTLY